MDEDLGAARSTIVAAGARLGAHGLIVATEGNLSVRIAAGRLLVTPSGRRKDELSPDDLVITDLSGDGADPAPQASKPSSDIGIHRAIYDARPSATAVVHAHVPAAMALTAAGEKPDPLLLPETAHFLPRLPMVPFGEMGSLELAERVAAALTAGDPQPGAVLLERHGAIAVGEGDAIAALGEAVDRMDLVDVLCRVWLDALLVKATARAREAVE